MGIIKKSKQKTVGFWAGDENNFQFLDPLINDLSSNYIVQKFDYNGDDKKLEDELRSVDISWFEWGNGPIIPATKLEHNTPIINRIHRYEIYSEAPKNIDWNRVNKSIFSSPSMIKRFEAKFPQEFSIAKPEFIEIGVDSSLFKFRNKTKVGKNIIYVGRIHPHKNPSLLLQIFAKLLNADTEYKLKIIGGFSDDLYEEYFYDQIEKLSLEKNIEFLGKMSQKEIVSHLQDSDFFLISSIIEGLSQASLEAMACGSIPVISNYYGSEKAYPKKYLYNTVDDAVEMLLNPVGTREESRSIIEESHLLHRKVQRVKQLIEEML